MIVIFIMIDLGLIIQSVTRRGINEVTEYGKTDIIKAADNIFNGIKWGLITGLIVGGIMVIVFFSLLRV